MSAHFIDIKSASLPAVASGATVLWSEMVTCQGGIEHDDTTEDDVTKEGDTVNSTLQRRG